MDIRRDIVWRTYVVYAFASLFALAIFLRTLFIQFVEGEKYREKAAHNTLRVQKIVATKGNIYASDAQSLLATSIPIYQIRMDTRAEALTDDIFYNEVDSLAYCLSNLFEDRTKSEYRDFLVKARKKGERYQLIKRKVKHRELKALKEFPLFRRGRYKSGLIVERQDRRATPFQHLAKRTIGYDSENSQAVGLEGAYRKELNGEDGQRLMQKIAGGVWMPLNADNEKDPKNGSDIYTTIDIDIQDVAEAALLKQLESHDAHHGCVIVMEVKTGAIKAIANLTRTSPGVYDEVYNYAIGQCMEPGSVIKLASAMAALEDGYIELDDIVNAEGGQKKFYNKMVTDHDVHYEMTIKRAFEVSSNVAFAKIITENYGNKPQQFVDRIRSFGLGDTLGIGISGEGVPLIKNVNDKYWSGITLPQMAYGYETEFTPLQILTFYNAVANNGKMVKPRLVDKIMDRNKLVRQFEPIVMKEKICSDRTIKKAQELLEAVVENGTASNLKNDNYSIAGKTSTAQILQKGSYQSRVYQSSFAGYFPTEDPLYSAIVVINAPSKGVYYGSQVAGPIFKEVSDKIFAKNIEMHQELDTLMFGANSPIPYSKSGNYNNIAKVFEIIGINPLTDNQELEWVRTSTLDSTVLIQSQTIHKDLVPNVTGMSIRDALYLLENKGLTVHFSGAGTIKKQSLPPGTRIRPNMEIKLELSI